MTYMMCYMMCYMNVVDYNVIMSSYKMTQHRMQIYEIFVLLQLEKQDKEFCHSKKLLFISLEMDCSSSQ